MDKFLKRIKQIESSGGRDIAHDRMLEGIHEGDAASGSYGIMPNTAKEFVNRRRLRGQYGPDEAIIDRLSNEEIKAFIESQPRIEQNLAEDIAQKVLNKAGGDEEAAAYLWNMGHNADIPTQQQLDESLQVKKFRKLKGLLDNNK